MCIRDRDDPAVTYEKILMKYNMRCKDGAVNTTGGNGVACGEWDYSCNTYIHDSTEIDSVLYYQPTHTISGFSGTSFNYTNQVLYDFYEYQQQQVILNNILGEGQYPVLSGGSSPWTLQADNQSGKTQILYTAAELTTAGFTAGDIHGFFLDCLLYTSPSPRDATLSRMPSSA